MIKISSGGCIRWKRPKQSRSPPRPVPRPPRQPLRQAKRRPPPPPMLVPGRRWAREQWGSLSASSSVWPSPSPNGTAARPFRLVDVLQRHASVARPHRSGDGPLPTIRPVLRAPRSNTSHRNGGVGRCKPTAWLALRALSKCGEYVGCGVYAELFQGVGLLLGAGDELIEGASPVSVSARRRSVRKPAALPCTLSSDPSSSMRSLSGDRRSRRPFGLSRAALSSTQPPSIL